MRKLLISLFSIFKSGRLQLHRSLFPDQCFCSRKNRFVVGELMKKTTIFHTAAVLLFALHNTVLASSPSMVFVLISEEGFSGQMSKYETTNAQYCQFLNAAKATGDITVSGDYVYGANGSNIGADFVGQVYYNLAGSGWTYNGATNGGAARINYSGGSFSIDSGFENHPVTYVSWYGSTAFCNYYGYRLPTEWEWQAVADYDGSYTYGCGTSINTSIANCNGSNHPDGTTIVGAFGTYGYGMCDMAGNVWEWTSSIYSGSSRVLRGGSWTFPPNYGCDVSSRYEGNPDLAHHILGFRVVLDISEFPPPPQEQPIYPEPNLPAEPNKLVFITHGWNTNPNDFNEIWIPFGEAIQTKINERSDANEWKVWDYNWTEDSMGTPGDALAKAQERGMAIGQCIAVKNYDHVHFIAHSAGAALISIAAEWVKAFSGMTNIHSTFLDPYTGYDTQSAKELYGKDSDFSENYFVGDITGRMTSTPLPYAHNVRLDRVDPGFDSHSFPWQWYQATVSGQYPNDDPLGDDNLANGTRYGFPLSLEDDGWDPCSYPPNEDNPVKIGDGLFTKLVKAFTRGDSALNITSSTTINSSTGTVDVNNTRITMGTSSPVWTMIQLDVNEPVNFVSFDANFTSEPNAEGLLAVYWGEEHLGNVDERYVLDGMREYSFELPQVYQPGTYVIKFRVDSFSLVPTTVIIDNISTGVGTAGYDYKIDGKIDFLDFAKFSSHWMQTDCNDNNNWCDRADLDESGTVDPNDLKIFTQRWLEGTQ